MVVVTVIEDAAYANVVARVLSKPSYDPLGALTATNDHSASLSEPEINGSGRQRRAQDTARYHKGCDCDARNPVASYQGRNSKTQQKDLESSLPKLPDGDELIAAAGPDKQNHEGCTGCRLDPRLNRIEGRASAPCD